MPALVQARLGALLDGDAAWVPVNDGLARLLEGSCVGTPAGGPAAAAGVAADLAAGGGAAAAAVASLASVGDPLACLVRLSLEEAVFCGLVLGGVVAASAAAAQPGGAPTPLSADALWAAACAARSPSALPFPVSYAAFHHCRAKGWVVRSGLRYGADFALYPGHPAASHAALLVLALAGPAGARGVVVGRGGSAGGTAGAPPSRPPSIQWLDIEIGNRLACQVDKRLLLLYVSGGAEGEDREGEAGGGAGGGRSAPAATAALARITIEERLVERWVPDTDREPPGCAGPAAAVKAAAAAAARAASRAAKGKPT